MSLPVWAAVIKDLIVAAAAACAAVFAYLGLHTWRKQLKESSEYDLAKRVLKSVYRVREAFKVVRNPAIYQFEFPPEMTDHHGHLKREHDYDGTAHVYETRWKTMEDAFRQLEEWNLDAQVEWGPEFQNRIVKLRACRAKLMIFIQQLLERKKNPEEPAFSELPQFLNRPQLHRRPLQLRLRLGDRPRPGAIA